MLLVAGMLVLPLVSLVNFDDAVPGVRVQTSAPADERALDLDRGSAAAASRARIELLSAEETSAMTAVPTTTTAAPTTTTAAPTTTTVKPTTTTAKPTTTTAKPTTTTAKPTTTTTAKPTTTTTAKPTTTTAAPATVGSEEGDASYYQSSDPAECAHRTLAFGTIVTVTNLENGKKTTCRVGDRGPFVDGRVIDLSSDKFAELAPLSEGVIRVRIEW